MVDIRIKAFSIPPALFEALMALPFGAALTADRRREAWLPAEPWARELAERMTEEARRYAAEVLGASAVPSGGLVCNSYGPGDSCQAHIDQYTRATHTGPETLHRTASASLLLRKAEQGGAMMFQDFARRRPPETVDPGAGKLILFPADWWHKVLPIAAGERRSVVGWWASESGQPFRSEAPAP